jgi:hypothetical protein
VCCNCVQLRCSGSAIGQFCLLLVCFASTMMLMSHPIAQVTALAGKGIAQQQIADARREGLGPRREEGQPLFHPSSLFLRHLQLINSFHLVHPANFLVLLNILS